MPTKTFADNSLGEITVIKRRSSRHLRLTIADGGKLRVSIPAWAPYQAGLEFARSHEQWIIKKRPRPLILSNLDPIGRAHHLLFTASADVKSVRTRITGNTILITHPFFLSAEEESVQKAARLAATRALRLQAEALLPKRLMALSEKHSLPFRSVRVKALKRRWGSCDQTKNIVLNIFLIQMPWELIDYVILHELAHTKHLNHGSKFWRLMTELDNNAKLHRKTLHKEHPGVISVSSF